MTRVPRATKVNGKPADASPPVPEQARTRSGRNSEFEVARGARIRATREAAGMSRDELGDVIGVKYQQIAKYEMGQNRITASTLQDLATAFGVHPGAFYGDAPALSGNNHDVRAAVRIAERIQRVRDSHIVKRLLALIDLLAGAEGGTADPEKPAGTSREAR